MNLVNNLKKIIVEAGKKLDLLVDEKDIKIEHPDDINFGDYSTNVAMALTTAPKASHLGGQANKTKPGEMANKIKEEISQQTLKNNFIEKIEVAGAGFINFYLKPEYLIKEAEIINYDTEFRKNLSTYGEGKTMVIDYSAPNIAKPFGIGHLRSTNIGQSIYNIYKILGWNCIGDNHLGDWGTQYGKLMAAIQHAKIQDSRFKIQDSEFNLDDLTINDLENLYVAFHREAEKDDTLIDEGREWFTKLESGDKEARNIWQKCVDISLLEFEKVYQLLGVHIDYIHGESFYEKMLPDITKKIVEKGITNKSEGAIIVELKDMPPAMLQKSNGTTTYFTRDMATIDYRIKTWNPDLIIYEVGVDQQLHFRQVFETVNILGWTTKTKLVHIAHGLIRWPTGKFSTRKGDTIHLFDVIDKAMVEAQKIADKTSVVKKMSASEKNEMVKKVAIGAVKFSDLSSDPKKDIIFDWQQIMNLDGDSGPYLQYTYARCKSVLSKTKIKETKNINEIPNKFNSNEMSLLKEFYKFEEKIIEASERFSPAVVAEYILTIARKYNEFYAKNRIIGEKEEVFRLFLTQTTASVIETGLDLLGIETVDKM